jgi:hypothetical protein
MSTYKAVKAIEGQIIAGTIDVSDSIAQASLASIDTKLTTGVTSLTYQNQVDVRRGALPGGSNAVTGHIEDLDNGDTRTIGTGLVDTERVTFDTTRNGVAFRVSSTDANDANGGTGATIVRVTLVNGSGVEEAVFADMAGTGAAGLWYDPVTFAVPFTNPVVACNQLVVVASGSGGFNVGNIFAGPAGDNWVMPIAGKPDTSIYHILGAGHNISRVASMYIPDGEDWFPCTWYITTNVTGGNDLVSVAIRKQRDFGLGPLAFENFRLFVSAGQNFIDLSCVRRFQPTDFIEFTATSEFGNNISISSIIGVIVVPIT